MSGTVLARGSEGGPRLEQPWGSICQAQEEAWLGRNSVLPLDCGELGGQRGRGSIEKVQGMNQQN